MEKSYRIHTNISNDTVLNVNMNQDYDFLEVLSLKLSTSDAYKLHSSNYGVIIGRVLANDAFGIPNAKVSVFIERDLNDPSYIESIYPYMEVTSKDKSHRRYNLLPDYSDKDCYRVVGTFPNKRLVLDDNIELEIYDKYWKFTTVTNNAGDYMIFGVPSGNQQVHVDLDLSDIGMLSQIPTDLEYKGYDVNLFDSPKQFKESTNLDNLAQIFSQNKSVYVYPFWGDSDLGDGIAAITRCDMEISYKFEPTCVFMGAIVSDNEGNSIGHKCSAEVDNGMNDQLIAGEGTIEMIRKTTDGLIEEYPIQGNQLIDSNGVWCYQIPMNLDYIGTDELGNIIPTDNPNKGIPTRAQVRFRFSKNETGDEGHSRHTAKYLVPMNPTFVGLQPKTVETKEEIQKMYTFGSSTPESCFRDLYWNNVYSVKNYIPKTQTAHRPYATNYTGLKGSNLAKSQNPIPFNKLRIDIPITYVIMCILFSILVEVVNVLNIVITAVNYIIKALNTGLSIITFGGLSDAVHYIKCIPLGKNLSEDNRVYAPGCGYKGKDLLERECERETHEDCDVISDRGPVVDLAQQKLAEDYRIIKLDFYQDWINGVLYMPLWFWRKRKKKKFLFFTISSAKNDFCDCDKPAKKLKASLTCDIKYKNNKLKVTDSSVPEGEDNWVRNWKRSEQVGLNRGGLIKGVENKDGLTAYYYAALQARDNQDADNKINAFRLFATDIILLGNLNESNLYGLPQFFKVLPSTTANVPPIASITEAAENTDVIGITSKNDRLRLENNNNETTTITGMDWLDGKGSPLFREGLFMELTCTSMYTKAKSCINVERLSELGMNLDMTYSVQFPKGDNLEFGTFEHDGLITKYELDDMENRAMFATMNHLGFVPQTYQDKLQNEIDIYFNETQVVDERTNYLVPKFKYMYPTDLDGRLDIIAKRYKNGFKQEMGDIYNTSYVNFRLGDVQGKGINDDSKLKGGGQFYYYGDDGYSMPLYNNSFYFYFGVKKGNTAIEKFNKMFYAQCFKTKKLPFTVDIDTKGMSYCPEQYKNENDGKSYIKWTSDDIEVPYSYSLVNSKGEEIRSGYNIEDNEYTISGDDIINDTYTLTITDFNGRSISEKADVSMPNIYISYETRDLGDKYYDGIQMGEICNNDVNGQIEFDRLYIDGYELKIYSAKTFTSNSEEIKVSISASTEGTPFKPDDVDDVWFHAADLELSVYGSENINECLCETVNAPSFYTGNTEIETSTGRKKQIFVFGFNIFKPNEYIISLSQYCGGGFTTNSTIFNALIENGSHFYTYINGMPIERLKGIYPHEETTSMPSGNSKNNLKPWFEVNSEERYDFPKYKDKTWNDFLTLIDNYLDVYNKHEIIRYKFERIFNLASNIYTTDYGDNNLKFTASGGVQPILYRSFVPNYADEDEPTTSFLYSDNNSVTIDPIYPNIVGDNYKDGYVYSTGSRQEMARINNLYSKAYKNYNGNYFMAATNNGGYKNQNEIDESEYSVSSPKFALVNVDDKVKKLGEDKVMTRMPEKLYTAFRSPVVTKPYFKAMTVDRRLDYDLAVIGPLFESETTPFTSITSSYTINGNAQEEYSSWIEGDEDTQDVFHVVPSSITPTTHIRLVGTVYNGIEMGYDFNDNIISANRNIDEEDEMSETIISNNCLEYSYSYSSGLSANIKPDTILVSPRANDGYWWKNYDDDLTYILARGEHKNDYISAHTIDSGSTIGKDKDTPILKTFYEASIGDVDIRQLFWSNDNYKFMSAITSSDTASEVNNWDVYENRSGSTLPVYIYSADTTTTKPYNGQFGYPDSSRSYPTKRYIDIGKIEPNYHVPFKLASCSYPSNAEINEKTNLFEARTYRGDSVDVELRFNTLKPSPRGEREDYGHFIYIVRNGYATDDENINYTGETLPLFRVNLGMNYKPMNYNGLEAYPSYLRLMTFDQIHEFKSGNKSLEELINEWRAYEALPYTIMGISDVTLNLPTLVRTSFNKEFQIYSDNKIDSETLNNYNPYNLFRKDGNIYIAYDNTIIGSNSQQLYNCRIGRGKCFEQLGNYGDYTYLQKIDGTVPFARALNDGGGIDLSGLTEFSGASHIAVSSMVELKPHTETNLSRKITLFEFSEFYNIKELNVKGSKPNPSGQTFPLNTEEFYIPEFETTFSSITISGDVINQIERVDACLVTKWSMDDYWTKETHFISDSDIIWNFSDTNKLDIKSLTFNAACTSLNFLVLLQGFSVTCEVCGLILYLTAKNGAIYKIMFNYNKIFER